jgi:hypothetical protein
MGTTRNFFRSGGATASSGDGLCMSIFLKEAIWGSMIWDNIDVETFVLCFLSKGERRPK